MDRAPEKEISRGIDRGAEDIRSLLTHPAESRLKRWVLLRGNRRTVAAALLIGVFSVLVLFGAVWPLEIQQLVAETTTVQTLFNTLLSGTVVLVSLVVSINWIVLSQDLTSLGEQQRRIENSLEFRREVEGVIGAPVTPADPAHFLQTVLDAIRRRGDELRREVSGSRSEELREHAEAYVAALENQAEQVEGALSEADPGSRSVLLAGLEYDYSWQIYTARRLQSEHADELPQEAEDALDDLVDALTFFGTGREYFKTLYYMQEFATLSRTLLYVSLPTIIFNSYVLLGIDAQQFPELTVLNLTPLMVFVSAAYTAALAPFVVLTAYVLRPATVAVRTLAAGPFVPRPGADDDPVDWED